MFVRRAGEASRGRDLLQLARMEVYRLFVFICASSVKLGHVKLGCGDESQLNMNEMERLRLMCMYTEGEIE